MRFRLVFFFLILFFAGTAAFAQIIPPDRDPLPPDAKIGSYYSVLPLIGYSSDQGFIGGGFLQRINYDINRKPFLSSLKTDITFSTRGDIISQLQYERTRLFGSEIRSSIDFVGQREKQAHYFGLGNDSQFSSSEFNDGLNFYENRELYLNYRVRQGFLTFGERGKIDFFGETSFWYVDGISVGEDTRFAGEEPEGFGSSRALKFGIGLIADSRNNEFAPSTGIRYEASLNSSQSFLFSNYSFSSLRGDFRHFIPIVGRVTLAHRLQAEHTLGDAPFWALPVIGNENGLRGFHRNRFRGDSSLLNMIEVRSWLFSVFSGRIDVGMHTFWDTGRVYSEFDSGAFFDNWKHVFVVGGAITLLNPDLIVRGDIGFSNETWRIYFGAGYVF
ncbi:MAG: BamA/TamA family outer membrane protein [Balneolaceae bacterium]|nr:BamA/TamA family outer membrane protein [Balneolaceae bacterium]